MDQKQYILVVSQIRGRQIFQLIANDTGTNIDTGTPGMDSVEGGSGNAISNLQLPMPNGNGTFTINVSQP